jgi:hypothetical protein
MEPTNITQNSAGETNPLIGTPPHSQLWAVSDDAAIR